MDFKFTTSDSADTLGYLSFLRLALNYWVSIDVACFTFDGIVCPVAVETPRYSFPGGYTPPPVRESSSPRSEILSPAGSIARDDPPSR